MLPESNYITIILLCYQNFVALPEFHNIVTKVCKTDQTPELVSKENDFHIDYKSALLMNRTRDNGRAYMHP